jgi:hypothetical protein
LPDIVNAKLPQGGTDLPATAADIPEIPVELTRSEVLGSGPRFTP